MGSGRLGCPHRSSRPLRRQERHARPHATRPLASVYNGRLSVYRDLTRNRPDERCPPPRPTWVDSQRPGEEVCLAVVAEWNPHHARDKVPHPGPAKQRSKGGVERGLCVRPVAPVRDMTLAQEPIRRRNGPAVGSLFPRPRVGVDRLEVKRAGEAVGRTPTSSEVADPTESQISRQPAQARPPPQPSSASRTWFDRR